MVTPLNESAGNDDERVLPTADEIGERFGPEAKRQWEAATDAKRAGMLKRLESEGEDAMRNDMKKVAARDALSALFAFGTSYGRVPGAEEALAARKARYQEEMRTESDPYRIAARSIHCRIIDEFLTKEYVDYTDVVRGALGDPLCASLDESIIGKIYLHFIATLERDKHIVRGTFDDDPPDAA